MTNIIKIDASIIDNLKHAFYRSKKRGIRFKMIRHRPEDLKKIQDFIPAPDNFRV
jgi:hypothetical protein